MYKIDPWQVGQGSAASAFGPIGGRPANPQDFSMQQLLQMIKTGGGAQQPMSAAVQTSPPPAPAPQRAMRAAEPAVAAAPQPSPFMQNVAAYGQQYGPNAYDFIPGVNDVQAKIAASQGLMDLLNKEGSSNNGNPWTVDAVMKLSNPNQGLDYWNDVASKWAAGQHPLQPS